MNPPPTSAVTGMRAALALLRPAQWIKNLVVLAPLVFAGQLADPPATGRALLATAAFALLASAGYAWNDLVDRTADRAHPAKRSRPLASGALPAAFAVGTALVCTAAGLWLGLILQRLSPPLVSGAAGPLAWLGAYVALGALYSLFLKRVAGLDVSLIALGLVARAGAGSAALQLQPSPWLLLCSFCFGLFLALLKRRAEALTLGARMSATRPMRPAWAEAGLARALDAAAGAAILGWLGYALGSDTAAAVGRLPLLLLLPVVAFGVLRARSLVSAPAAGDPVALLLRDGPALGAFLLWLGTLLWILYRP